MDLSAGKGDVQEIIPHPELPSISRYLIKMYLLIQLLGGLSQAMEAKFLSFIPIQDTSISCSSPQTEELELKFAAGSRQGDTSAHVSPSFLNHDLFFFVHLAKMDSCSPLPTYPKRLRPPSSFPPLLILCRAPFQGIWDSIITQADFWS